MASSCRAAFLAGGLQDFLLKYVGNSGNPFGLPLGKPDECVAQGSQYCLLALQAQGQALHWGTCVPNNCTVDALNGVFSSLGIHVTVSGGTCGWSPSAWSGGAIAVVAVFALLCVFGLSVTCLLSFLGNNIFRKKQNRRSQEKELLLNNNDGDNGENRKEEEEKPTPLPLVLRMFDWREGVQELAKETPLALRAFDGMRVAAILWIVLGHTLTFQRDLYDNPTVVQQMRSDSSGGWLFLWFISISLRHVDTFFFLSGCLLGYLAVRRTRAAQALGGIKAAAYLIGMRLLRLYPLYLTWLFVWWLLLPVISSGPIAAPFVAQQVDLCNQYWWTNILFVHNFWPRDFNDECLGWSWFLAVDTQLFSVLGPATIAVYWLFVRKGWSTSVFAAVVCAPLVVTSIVYRSVISHTLNAFYMSVPYMNYIYATPYSRSPPFIIGIVVGCLLSNRPQASSSASFSLMRFLNLALMAAAFLFCIVPLYYVEVRVDSTSFATLDSVYVALFPLAWGIAMACFAFAVYDRYLPGQKALELHVFAPLGKLGLSVYLVHPTILIVRTLDMMRLPTFSVDQVLSAWISCTFYSFCAAFAAYLVVEHPLATLIKRYCR